MGTHFGCFRLSEEGFDEPLRERAAAHRRHRLAERDFTALETGETRQCSFAQLEHAMRPRDAAA